MTNGRLTHEDLCALSRLVCEHMSLHVNQPGYRINEWLKREIAEASRKKLAQSQAESI